MDTRIDRLVAPNAFALQAASDRKRERQFDVPRDDEQHDAQGDADGVVLEPRERRDDQSAAVSRERLADEAGQRIDMQG